MTAISSRCDATLELGRKLTKELGLNQSVDTLGRWMAHYIAELVHDAENASAEERPAKMRACSDAVLSLWKHRHELPTGKRPFEKIEPILKTLESLDPDDETPKYFRSVRRSIEEADGENGTLPWLKLIEGLDYSARALIRYCLTQAALVTLDKSVEWVQLARVAGADEGIESSIVRFIGNEAYLLRDDDPNEMEKKELEDRIAKLESFIKIADQVASELRQNIRHIPSAR